MFLNSHTAFWLRRWFDVVQSWSVGWAQMLHFSAQISVLALSPSSYRRAQRGTLLLQVYRATRPLLLSFTLLSAVAAVVIIRIVVATSLSYGLSRYALDVLVRTLVLELIPLSAALAVAVRYSLAAGLEVRELRAVGGFEASMKRGLDPTRDIVLPYVLASTFAVVTLALLSGVVTLLLTYLAVYGFALWGVDNFTRAVGQVFNPVIGLIFLLKTLCFSVAVAVIPMVITPREQQTALNANSTPHATRMQTHAPADLTRLARLLAVILLIEVLSLVGNYY